jgi:hypothetical protein
MAVEADTAERRQKAGAVLIRFLSWTRLLEASVSSERMGWNGNSVKFARVDQIGKIVRTCVVIDASTLMGAVNEAKGLSAKWLESDQQG